MRQVPAKIEALPGHQLNVHPLIFEYIGLRVPPLVILAVQFYLFPDRTTIVLVTNLLAGGAAVAGLLPQMVGGWPGWGGLVVYYLTAAFAGDPLCVSRTLCLEQ